MSEQYPQEPSSGYRQCCPSCGEESSAAAYFCQWCGTRLRGQEDLELGYEHVAHLFCSQCNDTPNLAEIDGNEALVCHCTHVDGSLEPPLIHGFDNFPDPWEFVPEGPGGDQV